MSEKVLTVAEAASHFAELIDRARNLSQTTVIVDNGKPVARVVPAEPLKTTDEFLKAWPTMHHLTPEEAADFETDILAARRNMPPLASKWD